MTYCCEKIDTKPYLNEILPKSATGGTSVVVYGKHFHNIVSIELDGYSIFNFKKCHNKITFTMPNLNETKNLYVRLKTKNGTSNALILKYEKAAIFQANVIFPMEGSSSGGDQVSIYGIGLKWVTKIRFGEMLVSTFEIVNDNEIQLVSPPSNIPQTVKVSLRNKKLKNKGSDLVYTYLPPAPVITDLAPERLSLSKLTPSIGSERGGELITVNGTGLGAVKTVYFDNEESLIHYYLNNENIIIVAPPFTSNRLVNVRAKTDNEESNTLPYRYVPVPKI